MLSRNEVAETRALTPPRIYLVRMGVFLVLAGFLVFILYRPIWAAFLANPGLNGLILGVLLIGIVLAIRQVVRLFREVRWVNDLGRSDDEYMTLEQPVLLAPMAALLGNRASRTGLSVDHDALAPRFDRGAPRREPRARALPRRPARLPRPARHLLGPARHRRLGRQASSSRCAPGPRPAPCSTS